MFKQLLSAATIAASSVLAASAIAAPIVIGTYFEDSAANTCALSGCYVTLSPAPAGKRVTVKRIYCYVNAATTADAGYIQVGTSRTTIFFGVDAFKHLSFIYDGPTLYGDSPLYAGFQGIPSGVTSTVSCNLIGELSNK